MQITSTASHTVTKYHDIISINYTTCKTSITHSNLFEKSKTRAINKGIRKGALD